MWHNGFQLGQGTILLGTTQMDKCGAALTVTITGSLPVCSGQGTGMINILDCARLSLSSFASLAFILLSFSWGWGRVMADHPCPPHPSGPVEKVGGGLEGAGPTTRHGIRGQPLTLLGPQCPPVHGVTQGPQGTFQLHPSLTGHVVQAQPPSLLPIAHPGSPHLGCSQSAGGWGV